MGGGSISGDGTERDIVNAEGFTVPANVEERLVCGGSISGDGTSGHDLGHPSGPAISRRAHVPHRGRFHDVCIISIAGLATVDRGAAMALRAQSSAGG